MYKQVIVIRRNLPLSKGKLAAQVAHASLEAYKRADRRIKERWEAGGAKKVVLRAENTTELLDIRRRARADGLPAALIRDAGHTEVPAGTITALGIGPDNETKINKITGKLKML